MTLAHSIAPRDEKSAAIAPQQANSVSFREYEFKTVSHFLRLCSLTLIRLNELHTIQKIVHYDLDESHLIISPAADGVTLINADSSAVIGKPLKPKTKAHRNAAPESIELAALAHPSNDVYSVFKLFSQVCDQKTNQLVWHLCVERRFQEIFQFTQTEDPAQRLDVLTLAAEMQHLSVVSYHVENQDRLADAKFDATREWAQLLPAAVRDLEELTEILGAIKPGNVVMFLEKVGLAQLRKIVNKNDVDLVLAYVPEEEIDSFLEFFNQYQLLTARRMRQLTAVSVRPSSLFKPAENFVERGEKCLALFLKTETLDEKEQHLLKQPLGLEALGRGYIMPKHACVFGQAVLKVILTKEGLEAFHLEILTDELIMKLLVNQFDVPKVLSKIIADRENHLKDKTALSTIYFPT